MKKRLTRTFLIGVFLLVMSEVAAIGGTAGPDRAVVEREARQIEHLRAKNDIDGLIDILPKAHSYPKGGGLERRKRMIDLLEQQAKEALEAGREDRLSEICRKLLILDPRNQAYRSCLPQEMPRLAIYYVKEDRNETSLEEVVLDDYRLMTEQDIVGYDWDTHTITLTKEGIQRIPAGSTVGVRGRSFVVVADGHRCYKGAFWTSFSSISCPLPVIDVLRLNNQTRQVRIERAYPTAKFGRRADPRFDSRIRKVLEETGKLRYSKSGKGHAEPTVPPPEAARD